MNATNPWGKRPDPRTGLTPYSVRSGATETRLRRQAADARARRARIEQDLAETAKLFDAAFAEADRAAQTQARITALAKNKK